MILYVNISVYPIHFVLQFEVLFCGGHKLRKTEAWDHIVSLFAPGNYYSCLFEIQVLFAIGLDKQTFRGRQAGHALRGCQCAGFVHTANGLYHLCARFRICFWCTKKVFFCFSLHQILSFSKR